MQDTLWKEETKEDAEKLASEWEMLSEEDFYEMIATLLEASTKRFDQILSQDAFKVVLQLVSEMLKNNPENHHKFLHSNLLATLLNAQMKS